MLRVGPKAILAVLHGSAPRNPGSPGVVAPPRRTKVHICFRRADFGKIDPACTSVFRVGAFHLGAGTSVYVARRAYNPRGPMTQPTIHAAPEVRPVASAEPMLPETRERQCPSCHGAWIVHAGHVIGGGGEIKTEHRCELCGTRFWFVRKRVPLSGALTARLDDGWRQDQASPAS